VAGSLVYRNSFVYELIIRVLYGRHHEARYRAIADLIPARSSVLDLCCGPGVLHDRYLRHLGVEYTGLDISPSFIERVNRQGGRGYVWDLLGDRPLPSADSVIMQASLYQFLPDAAPVVRRMLQAAREQVVIAEPIRNLSTSRIPLLAALARRLTDAGCGVRPGRFTEQSLSALLDGFEEQPIRSFLIPGGRERVYVLDPRPGRNAGTPRTVEKPAAVRRQ
jgi:SAM-dependent methyltransferase